MIFRHHPNSRPESCAQRAARTKFYFSVAKREKPTCIDFGGSIGNPLTKLNRRGLTKRTDRKSVIPNEQILCIIPIILLFIVSPTGGKWGSVLGNRPVADPNIPFGSIQSSAAKGILPSQLIKGRHENHSWIQCKGKAGAKSSKPKILGYDSKSRDLFPQLLLL